MKSYETNEFIVLKMWKWYTSITARMHLFKATAHQLMRWKVLSFTLVQFICTLYRLAYRSHLNWMLLCFYPYCWMYQAYERWISHSYSCENSILLLWPLTFKHFSKIPSADQSLHARTSYRLNLSALLKSLKAVNNVIFAQLLADYMFFVNCCCCCCFYLQSIQFFFPLLSLFLSRRLIRLIHTFIHVMNILKVSCNFVRKQFNSQ